MALDPDTRSARDFLIHSSQGTLLSHYLISELAHIAAQRDIDEDDRTDQMDALLQRLDYSTTFARATEEFDAMANEELGYWAGRYTVVDEKGATYSLDLADGSATLAALTAEEGDPAGLLHATDYAIANRVLTLRGEQLSAVLTLVLPLTPEQEAKDDLDLHAEMASGEARVTGTITRRGNARSADGKRGCFTAAGAKRALDGDPPTTWAGTYQLLYSDDAAMAVAPLRLALIANGDAVDVTLGGKPVANARWIGNRLVGGLPGDKPVRFGGAFTIAPGEQLRFFGALEIDDKARSIVGVRAGDARAPGPPDQPPVNPPADRPPVKRPTERPANPRVVKAASAAHKTLEVNPNFSSAPRQKTLDMSTLVTVGKKTWLRAEQETDADGKPKVDPATKQPVIKDVYATVYAIPEVLLLPLAVERNAYVIDFLVEKLAATHAMFAGLTVAADKVLEAERVEIDDDGYTKAFTRLRTVEVDVQVDGQSVKQNAFRYEVIGGETESAHWYNSYLAFWPHGKPDQRVHVFMSMGVGSRIPIAITADLPTIFVDKAFSGGVTGNGGEPTLSWEAKALDTDTIFKADGPITFDPANQTFSGTISSVDLAGRSYAVKITAAAADTVIMQPATLTATLRVDLLATAIDSASLGVGVIGMLFGAGASIALGVQWLMKRSKRSGRRDKAIKEVAQVLATTTPKRDELRDAIIDAYKKRTNFQESLTDARDAVRTFGDALRTQRTAADVARETVRKALRNEHLSPEDRVELEGEQRRLDDRIGELEQRARDAERMNREIDRVGKRAAISDTDFETHIKGKL